MSSKDSPFLHKEMKEGVPIDRKLPRDKDRLWIQLLLTCPQSNQLIIIMMND